MQVLLTTQPSSLQISEMYLKYKEMKYKVIENKPANTNHKKVEIAIVILYKEDFRERNIRTEDNI